MSHLENSTIYYPLSAIIYFIIVIRVSMLLTSRSMNFVDYLHVVHVLQNMTTKDLWFPFTCKSIAIKNSLIWCHSIISQMLQMFLECG